jgi:hypothetical protein
MTLKGHAHRLHLLREFQLLFDDHVALMAAARRSGREPSE